MPELTPQSSAAPAPPPVSPGLPPIPPEVDPPEPPPAIPPIIAPEDHEEFPTFRETFLVFFTDPEANATMRAFGKLLLDFTLATWGDWPHPPEGMFRASLRSAVADLRHVQGSLLEWTGETFSPATPHEGYLATVGDRTARAVGEIADRLEAELGSFRGKV